MSAGKHVLVNGVLYEAVRNRITVDGVLYEAVTDRSDYWDSLTPVEQVKLATYVCPRYVKNEATERMKKDVAGMKDGLGSIGMYLTGFDPTTKGNGKVKVKIEILPDLVAWKENRKPFRYVKTGSKLVDNTVRRVMSDHYEDMVDGYNAQWGGDGGDEITDVALDVAADLSKRLAPAWARAYNPYFTVKFVGDSIKKGDEAVIRYVNEWNAKNGKEAI